MIIWIASYPRSGNTLLRTVLRQCFGIQTYSDEIDPEIEARVGLSSTVVKNIGHLPLPMNWDDFYPQAQATSDPVFIKTHRLPRDKAKSIYVVRDGRQALVSYEKYHQSFLNEKKLSLIELILGLDYYGSWADHYKAWKNEDTLILRYEDLVRASDQLLEKIEKFIGFKGTRESWVNPFTALNQENPDFFRIGNSSWNPPKNWTPLVNAAFNAVNFELMRELGYLTAEVDGNDMSCQLSEINHLMKIVGNIVSTSKFYHETCIERLKVIELLDAEVKRLHESLSSGV